MKVAGYLLGALLLVGSAFAVFRIKVRRDYRTKGRLTLFSSFLELLVWGMYFCFPYLYNPADWPWPNTADIGPFLQLAGNFFVMAGLIAVFGTMVWFGVRRAFGFEVSELIVSGPYRVCRNPQITAGALLVVGVVLLLPSWYALGWVAMYVLISHMMVLTEEEHLRAVFGARYESYCRSVPRYVRLPRRS